MTSKRYLYWIGALMIAWAVLGWVHILGVGSGNSLFGANFFSTRAENWTHLVLGVAALLVGGFVESRTWLSWTTSLFGIVAIIAGIVGFFASNFLGFHLEITENIVNLVIGATALWAVYAEMPMSEMTDMPEHEKGECIGADCPPKGI